MVATAVMAMSGCNTLPARASSNDMMEMRVEPSEMASLADRDTLVQHLLTNGRGGDSAKGLREEIEQQLDLQDRILTEAGRLGMFGRPDVRVRAELERRRVLVEAYWEEWFRNHPITEDELKAAYDALRLANGGKQYRLSQIVVRGDEDMARAIESLRQGASFVEVAKVLSIERVTAERGGDIGWRWKTELLPAVAEGVDSIKPGSDLMPIVQAPEGRIILKLEGVREQEFPPFEQLRTSLEKNLRREAEQRELRKLKVPVH